MSLNGLIYLLPPGYLADEKYEESSSPGKTGDGVHLCDEGDQTREETRPQWNW